MALSSISYYERRDLNKRKVLVANCIALIKRRLRHSLVRLVRALGKVRSFITGKQHSL